MKQKICFLVVFFGILAIVGIVGGCDHGQPLTNVWWCVPILAVMRIAVSVGHLDCYEEE